MNEALIEKVRKLLSKTEQSGCTQAEAEAAYRMASKLMADHNLSMAEVNAGPAEEAWADEEVDTARQWSLEIDMASSIAAKFFFVERYRTRIVGKGKVSLLFFGRPENVATARFVYQSLLTAFGRLWSDYRIIHRRPVTDRRLFIVGVAEGFKGKLQDERDAEKIERDILSGRSGGTAIALANIAEQTKLALHQTHKLGRGTSGVTMPRGDQSTLQAGITAGRNLNLNRAVGGSGRKAIGD